MQLSNYGLTVLVDGQAAREFGHDGRTFIVGRAGADFTIRPANRSPRRVKVVLAVDGLSVIDGKTAAQHGSGYILEPWSTLDVPGWRLSDERVARFAFAPPGESYAAATGKASHVGIIGAAFFEEVDLEPIEKTSGGLPGVGLCGLRLESAGALRASGGSLGTAFGRPVDSAVRRVAFTAKSAPAAVIEIRYEDAAILRGLGLDIDEEAAALHAPEAFPAGTGYCAPPRNWSARR